MSQSFQLGYFNTYWNYNKQTQLSSWRERNPETFSENRVPSAGHEGSLHDGSTDRVNLKQVCGNVWYCVRTHTYTHVCTVLYSVITGCEDENIERAQDNRNRRDQESF